MKVNKLETCILLFLIAMCTLAIGSSALAQSDTSSLTGTVTDSSGAALPNAKVLVRNNDTHVERTTLSNESGSFNLTNLPPGNYTVRVEATNFQTTTLGDVHVDPSIGRRVDISMKVGQTTTEVTVEAGVNGIQTEMPWGRPTRYTGAGQEHPTQQDATRSTWSLQMEPGCCSQQFYGSAWLVP